MKHFRPESGRYKRQGFPEAIYSPGKTLEQIIKIAKELLKADAPVIATKAGPEIYKAVRKRFKDAEYFNDAGIILFNSKIKKKSDEYICVLTAGTSDIKIAEESAVIAEIMGVNVKRIYDVGVSGIHRLLEHSDKLNKAKCAVVCAGMEGALASVVGGLVSCPVIAVPTSVGYGAAFGGVSALLTMLNSCAPNVCTVNIDDGFGAGITASLICLGGIPINRDSID